MAMYFKITDGTETIDLLGDGDFNLEIRQWAPKVPRRRQSRMGGPLFHDVMEEIPLYSKSDDAATVLASIAQLNDMIDRAWRWKRREIQDPVIMRYSPTSDSDYYEAVILGSPDGEAAIELPQSFHDNLYQGEVDSIVLKFKHKPLLDDEESASSSSANAPAVMTAEFSADQTVPSLLKVQIGGIEKTTISGGINGILAISGRLPDDLLFEEAEDFSVDAVPGSGTFNSASDSAASGGDIRKLVPNSAGDYVLRRGTAHANVPYIANEARVALYLSVRNNSPSISYTVNAYYDSSDGIARFPETIIDTSTQDPRIHFCGIIESPFDKTSGTTIYITFTPSGTGNSSHALDIDSVFRARLTDTTRIITVANVASVFGDTTDLYIDHRALTNPTASVFEDDPLNEVQRAIAFGGDIYLEQRPDFYTDGVRPDSAAAILFATTGSQWRPVSGTTTVQNLTFTAIRRPIISVPS